VPVDNAALTPVFKDYTEESHNLLYLSAIFYDDFCYNNLLFGTFSYCYVEQQKICYCYLSGQKFILSAFHTEQLIEGDLQLAVFESKLDALAAKQ